MDFVTKLEGNGLDQISLKRSAKAELNSTLAIIYGLASSTLHKTAFVARWRCIPANENMHRAGIRVVAHAGRRMMTKWLLEQHRNVADSRTFIGFADSAAHDRCQLRHD